MFLSLMYKWVRGYNIVASKRRHGHGRESRENHKVHLAAHRPRAIVRLSTKIESPDVESFGAAIVHMSRISLLVVSYRVQPCCTHRLSVSFLAKRRPQ